MEADSLVREVGIGRALRFWASGAITIFHYLLVGAPGIERISLSHKEPEISIVALALLALPIGALVYYTCRGTVYVVLLNAATNRAWRIHDSTANKPKDLGERLRDATWTRRREKENFVQRELDGWADGINILMSGGLGGLLAVVYSFALIPPSIALAGFTCGLALLEIVASYVELVRLRQRELRLLKAQVGAGLN